MNIKGIHCLSPGSKLNGFYFIKIGDKYVKYKGNIRYSGNNGIMNITGPPNTVLLILVWDEIMDVDAKRERYIEIYQNKSGCQWPEEITGFKRKDCKSLMDRCSYFDSVQIVSKDLHTNEYIYSMPDVDVYDKKKSYLAALSEVIFPEIGILSIFTSEDNNSLLDNTPISCVITVSQL